MSMSQITEPSNDDAPTLTEGLITFFIFHIYNVTVLSVWGKGSHVFAKLKLLFLLTNILLQQWVNIDVYHLCVALSVVSFPIYLSIV